MKMNRREELFSVLDAANDDDLTVGAWWCVLEDTVEEYNDENRTGFDPFESVLSWVISRGVKE